MAEKPLATAFIVAGVVIRREGKYLLVQEQQPKVYGKWNLPAGRVDQGESLEEAAVREAREECGLEVTLGAHLIALHQSVDSPVLHAYEAVTAKGDVVVQEGEILDAKWFSYDEIVAMRDELRNPDFILGAIEASRG